MLSRQILALISSVILASSIQAAQSPELIKLNQLGYQPTAEKLALIPGDAVYPYQLLALPSGQPVLSGTSQPARRWAPAGHSVSLVDFTTIQQTGHYRLQVAGYAAADVHIASQPYSQLHDSAIKAFYYNRASTALLPEHAGRWARAAGHPDNQVTIHSSAASTSRPAGTVLTAAKGWYDAGDYNKYVVNSGISTYTLLLAFSDFREFYQQRQWQIPESGKGIPDLLAEINWNLEWLSNMQDPADGGVYHKLTTLNFAGIVMPAEATAQRYLVQKSTAAALNFAAVMAKASRVLQPFESQLPGKASLYRQQALAAWHWASQHPKQYYHQPADVFTGAYADNQLDDERAWAAAELFLLTGEPTYLQKFFRLGQPVTTPSWANVATLGYFSLANNTGLLSPEQQQQVVKALTTAADNILVQHHDSAYRVAMQANDFVWGSNAVALNKAILLHKAGQISSSANYQPAIQGLLDYVLGRNPTDFSYVTGYGINSPLHIHHRPSAADGIAAPVPGWLAGGAQPGQQDKCLYNSNLPATTYLDDWCSYATNEVAINWNAPLVYVLAAMSQP